MKFFYCYLILKIEVNFLSWWNKTCSTIWKYLKIFRKYIENDFSLYFLTVFCQKKCSFFTSGSALFYRLYEIEYFFLHKELNRICLFYKNVINSAAALFFRMFQFNRLILQKLFYLKTLKLVVLQRNVW